MNATPIARWHRQRKMARSAAWLFALLLPSGCASVTERAGTSEDVHANRKAREAQVLRDFEARRDAAQHQAAIGRLQCGDVAEARKTLDTILARNPAFLPARLSLAELLLDANEPAQALDQARFVLERAPNDPAARHVEGLILEALGRSDEALASFQLALDGEPENEVYRLSFQTAAQTIVPTDAAVRQAEWTERPSPRDVEGTLAAATAALQRNDTEESVQLLSAALAQAPEDIRLLRALGVCHYRRGACGEAQVVLAKAVSLDASDPLSYFLLGATLRRLGQTADAERHFAKAAELDPRYATWR